MKRFFILVPLAYLFVSCDKDNISVERPFPKTTTLEVLEINAEGATFLATIDMFSDEEIIDHGFIWKTNPESIEAKYSLGRKSDSNPEFSVPIRTGLEEGLTYSVNAYVYTPTYKITGNTVTFVSLGSQGPIIDNVVPQSGFPGDTIVISGKNFIADQNKLKVNFGEFEGTIIETNESEIIVIVPPDLNKKESTLSLSIGEEVYISPTKFTLSIPDQLNFWPKEGFIGDPIWIFAENLHLFSDAMEVIIGTEKAKILNVKQDSILVEVPSVVFNWTPQVTVLLPESEILLPGNFSIRLPKINGIKPAEGKPGDVIWIFGDNLDRYFNLMEAYVGYSFAETLELHKDSAQLEIPYLDLYVTEKFINENPVILRDVELLPAGDPDAYIRVIFGKFKYILPRPLSFSPLVGSYGDTITLVGNDLMNFEEFLSVGIGSDWYGNIVSHTSDEIKLIVPNKTTEITNLVRMNSVNYEFTMEEIFVMKRPTIVDVSPKIFSVGDEITVTVEYPNPVLAYNHFTINDYYTQSVSMNGNQIVIKVPHENFTGDLYLEYATGEYFKTDLHDRFDTPLNVN